MPAYPITQPTVTVVAGDLEVGAVEMKDSTLDVRAKVAAPASITESDAAVAMYAAILGATTGAALDADGPGTLQQYLRGLLKAFLARLTACNTGAVAGSVTANAGTNLNTSALAVEAGGHLDSIDGKIASCNTGAIVGSVGITQDTIPINCNAPVVVAIAAGTWTDISAALVANARYELVYIPTVITDEVFFYLRDDTAAILIAAVVTSGRVCRSGTPIPVTPSTATPLALLRHPSTALDGTVYLTRLDN